MSDHRRSPSTVLIPVVLVVIGMASIQIGAAIAKQLFPAVGSTGAATLRLIFAAVILVAVLRPWRVRLGPGDWRSIVVYGIAIAGMNGLYYASLRTVPLGIAVALEFAGPLFVAVMSSRRVVDFLWIGLAIGGLVFLLPIAGASGHIDLVGAALALGAGACWAMYIVFGQKAGAEHGVQMTAIGVVVAAVCIFPFGIAQSGSALMNVHLVPFAITVAVLSTALPLSLEMVGLSRLPRRTFGTLMSLEPAIGALSGLVLLHEHLTTRQWLAIGLIVAASAGSTATAARQSDLPQKSDPPGFSPEHPSAMTSEP